MCSHSPNKGRAFTLRSFLGCILSRGESPWLQALCSKQDQLRMLLWQGSIYTPVKSELW